MANEELKQRNLEHVMQTILEQCLRHGIENTTKEMVVRASGLSRASLDRYFVNKADGVVQMAEWAAKKIAQRNAYLEDMLCSGQYTGAQMVEQYLLAMKAEFCREPYIFVLIVELRSFVFRNCIDSVGVYRRLCSTLGNGDVLQRIFCAGLRDGSMSVALDIERGGVLQRAVPRFLCRSGADVQSHSPSESGGDRPVHPPYGASLQYA